MTIVDVVEFSTLQSFHQIRYFLHFCVILAVHHAALHLLTICNPFAIFEK